MPCCCFCSVAQSVWLFLTPFHYLLEFPYTHVHWVNDAIQPFYPVTPFSYCPQSFPESGSFPMNPLFTSDGQSTGALVSAKVLPMNIQGWFPFRIDWFDLLAVQGILKSLLQYDSLKASVLQCTAFFIVQLFISIHDYWKNHSFDYIDLCQQSDVSVF